MAYPQSPYLTGGYHALLLSQFARRSGVRGSGSVGMLHKLHSHDFHPPADVRDDGGCR